MEILNNSCDNVGGVAVAYAIPSDALVKISHNYSRDTRSFTLNSIEGLIEIDSVRTSSFVSENDGEKCSVVYQGAVIGLNKRKEKILDKLVKGSWLLLHRDRRGVRVLSGTKESPLFFSYKKDSGSAPGQSNSISFTFKGEVLDNPGIIDFSPI